MRLRLRPGLWEQLVPAVGSDDFVSAFATMARERADALIVMPSPMLFSEYRRIVRIAANSRLPAMGAAREFADVGGLMSYGVNLPDLARQTATYVDKILKGAKPAELPVEQPTKFELVINLKTARELEIEAMKALRTALQRADQSCSARRDCLFIARSFGWPIRAVNCIQKPVLLQRARTPAAEFDVQLQPRRMAG
jgi:ABC transporter substrate binding protein